MEPLPRRQVECHELLSEALVYRHRVGPDSSARLGVPADRRADLTSEPLDLPGTLLTIAAIGLGCYTLTSGVQNGWLSLVTIACAAGTVAAVAGCVVRERRAASPMIDLTIFRAGPVRGAALTQLGASVAFASVLFGLILHFQYAYGWSLVRVGLANLPVIVTMLAATPITERLAARLGHRAACPVGTGLLVGALVGMAWAVDRGYLAIAVMMVVLTVGLRTIMTICAVALVEAMPANRTSVEVIGTIGSLSLTDSRSVEEPASQA
ncbi:hypothetical protein [Rathayibacter tritici]|uniref:hypothetical protein n=1 Tax=Rathayibacter tritici TaxID=33888 RepID=UPI0020120725|nr:hypothetical protein [Rathayibacter tritici]